MNRLLLNYNLQYFAEDTDPNKTGTGDTDPNKTGTGDTDPNNTGTDDAGIDASAFADIISEKDKAIQQLQQDVAELKKTNAKLLVQVSAGANRTEFNTEKAILEFCDTRKTN